MEIGDELGGRAPVTKQGFAGEGDKLPEWSAPAKNARGEWTTGEAKYEVWATLAGDDIRIAYGSEEVDMPADAALRLLAAEASERLGWVWDVHRAGARDFMVEARGKVLNGTEKIVRVLIDDISPGAVRFDWFQPSYHCRDDLLAAMHGGFLLEAAMKTGE